MLPNFHVERNNLYVYVKFNVISYVTCQKNITLLILLKYVSLERTKMVRR